MARKRPSPESEVYSVRDPYSMLGGSWLVLGPTFHGARAVGYQPAHMPGVQMGVVDRVILGHHLQNYPRRDENISCASQIARVKELMLLHGASPLAVQWVGDISPFEEKELKIMADKLTKKNEKPAAKGDAKGGRKGNPEALAKARAARAESSAGPDTRKIKVLCKPHGAREGTIRAGLLDTIYASKTVQEAVDAGVKKSDVSWAAREEYISIG